jgi:hypothetical protein
MAPRAPSKGWVNLLGVIQFLHRHLNKTLCEKVFWSLRDKERQRIWTLHRLVLFWIAVIARAPRSLTEILEASRRGGDPVTPAVESTPEAFFLRCQQFHFAFFAELYRRFTRRILRYARPVYLRQLARLRKVFPEIWVVDGSGLDAVARRLKPLRRVRAVVLGGCVLAFYDLFRGIPRGFYYDPDAAASESRRAEEALEDVPPGTLLLGDRLYGTVKLFAKLALARVFGLFRRHGAVSVRRLQRLRRKRTSSYLLEDSLVMAGSGQKTPAQKLRRIRLKQGRRVVLDLLTNVLDPLKLSAEDALLLYAQRWKVERLFFDLKEVLHLHRFYESSPNGVGMQVFAAALVHTAFRIAQGRIAREHGLAPEDLSPAKLFPRLAKASVEQAVGEITFDNTKHANPRFRLRSPRWGRMPWARVPIAEVLVEPRKGKRRRRRYCESRKTWTSFDRIPGVWK